MRYQIKEYNLQVDNYIKEIKMTDGFTMLLTHHGDEEIIMTHISRNGKVVGNKGRIGTGIGTGT